MTMRRKTPQELRDNTEDDTAETPEATPEPEPIRKEESGFDLADLAPDAKTEIRRLNLATGNYALLGVLTGPSGWEQVAARWGGGQYTFTVKRAGKYQQQGHFEIEAATWTPRGGGQAQQNQTPPPLTNQAETSTTDRVLEALAGIQRTLAAQTAPAAQSGVRDILELVTMLRKQETAASSGGLLETLKMGIELGKSATGSTEKGLSDVLAELGPKVLELVQERDRMAYEQSRALPSRRPDTPGGPRATSGSSESRAYIVAQLRRLIEASKIGVKPDDAAELAERMLPGQTMDEVTDMDGNGLLARVAEILPAERDYLTTPTAREWFHAFLARLQAGRTDTPTEADDATTTTPGDGETGMPEGDSGTQG